jgi:DNA-binding SARP family transcriptional activator
MAKRGKSPKVTEQFSNGLVERAGQVRPIGASSIAAIRYEFREGTNFVRHARLELLGAFRVTVSGREIDRFQTQKTASLLAYLALRPGQEFGREEIARHIWPDGESRAIRNRLNQAVSSLRRELHGETMTGDLLRADHHSVALNPDLASTDVAEFLALLKSADESDDAATARDFRRQAAELYRGDLLSSLVEPWVTVERTRLRELQVSALAELTRSFAQSGDLEAALDYAYRRADLDPTSEQAHRTIMKLLVRSGRPSAATQHYQNIVALFRARNIPVSAKTHQVAESARLAEANPATHSDGTAPIAPNPDPLPRFEATWVSRRQLVARLRSLLANPSPIWITLTGLPGCGKSRLAIEAAKAVASERHASWGYLRADVRSSAECVTVAKTWMQGVGAGSVLIVDVGSALDNGHLAEIHDLAQRSAMSVLATTSQVITVGGHVDVSIPAGLEPEEAAQLLTDQWTQTNPAECLDKRVAPAIVKAVAGMPRSLIRIAAQSVTITGEEAIDRCVAAPLEFDPDWVESIRPVIASLSEETRRCLADLCQTRAPWTSAACEAFNPEGDSLHRMQELAHLGLVTVESREGQRLFSALPQIRDAVRRLNLADSPDFGTRLARAGLALAQRMSHSTNTLYLNEDIDNISQSVDLLMDTGQWADLAQLGRAIAEARRHYLLCPALSRLVAEIVRKLDEHGQRPAGYAGLLEGMLSARELNERDPELDEWRRRQISSCGTGDSTGDFEAYMAAALSHRLGGNYADEASFLRKAREIARGNSNSTAAVRATIRLGHALTEANDFDVAIAEYESAVALARSEKLSFFEFVALGGVANVGRIRGDVPLVETISFGVLRHPSASKFPECGLDTCFILARSYLKCGRAKEAVAATLHGLDRWKRESLRLPFLLGTMGFALVELGVDRGARWIASAELNARTSPVFLGIEKAEFVANLAHARTKLSPPVFERDLLVGRMMDETAQLIGIQELITEFGSDVPGLRTT